MSSGKQNGSIIEHILDMEDLERFSGPVTKKIVERINKQLKKYDTFTDKQIRDATASLGALTPLELVLLLQTQDEFCERCGNCCRICYDIAFSQGNLKAIAKRRGVSYKKLKRKIKARPAGRAGMLFVPGRPCLFLRGMNECAVYDLRPAICRVYPMGKTCQEFLNGKKPTLIPADECPAMETMLVNLACARLMSDEVIHKAAHARAR